MVSQKRNLRFLCQHVICIGSPSYLLHMVLTPPPPPPNTHTHTHIPARALWKYQENCSLYHIGVLTMTSTLYKLCSDSHLHCQWRCQCSSFRLALTYVETKRIGRVQSKESLALCHFDVRLFDQITNESLFFRINETSISANVSHPYCMLSTGKWKLWRSLSNKNHSRQLKVLWTIGDALDNWRYFGQLLLLLANGDTSDW